MPKRSNDFQRLITFLEKQLAPIGATVQESAMLKELDSDEEREVDILIEYEVGNHPIRIALECRAHKRPQGKPWLEEIAGKYKHLPIDHVIAVSSSGFTKTVFPRAEKEKIRLLSLEEALKEDWPEAFTQYNMGLVLWHYKLTSATPTFKPKDAPQILGDELLKCLIRNGRNGEITTFEQDVLMIYFEQKDVIIRDWFENNMEALWKGGPGKEWNVKTAFKATDKYLQAPNGQGYELDEITITLKAHFELRTAESRYYSYNRERLATAELEPSDDEKIYRFALLFNEDGTPKALNVQVKPKEQAE